MSEEAGEGACIARKKVEGACIAHNKSASDSRTLIKMMRRSWEQGWTSDEVGEGLRCLRCSHMYKCIAHFKDLSSLT